MLLTRKTTAASIFKGLKMLWRIMLHLGAVLFWTIVILFWAAIHFREVFQETPIKTTELIYGYYAAETQNSSFLELRNSYGTTKIDKINYLCVDGNNIHGEIHKGRFFIYNVKERNMYKSPETTSTIENFLEYLNILADEGMHICLGNNIVKSPYLLNEEENSR